MRKNRGSAAILLVVPLAAAGVGGTSSASSTPKASAHEGRFAADVTLNGAGANSAAPFYQTVFAEYEQANAGVTINYSPAGSSVGVSDIEQGTVNFGQSEIPMASADLRKAQATVGNVLQLPVDLGAVAISYNIPNVPSGLKLSGPVLADIFDGKVTNWDAPEIARISGDKHLPNLPIVPVHRADSSGPGWDLDAYLIKTSGTWIKAIGTNVPSKSWPEAPVGVGEQLNTGVATYIAQTRGSIGFVEYAYVRKNKFDDAALQNLSGRFVQPDFQSITASGKHAIKLSWSNFDIVDVPGTTTYPLVNFSWALIAQKQTDATTGRALKALFSWVITTGQKYANYLGYAKLPGGAVALAKNTLTELETANGKPLTSI